MSLLATALPKRSGWWLWSRVSWLLIAGGTLGLYLGSLPAAFRKWSALHPVVECRISCGLLGPVEWEALQALGLTPQLYAGYHILLVTLLGLIPFVIGTLTYLRQPDQGSTWFFSLVLAQIGFMVPPVFDAGVEAHPSLALPAAILLTIGRAAVLISLYLFPNGRFVPPWTRWLALSVAAMFLVMFAFPSLPFNLVVYETTYRTFSPPTVLLAAGWLGSGIFAQIYRYLRESNAVERQQTKWVIYGWIAAFIGFVSYISPYFIVPALSGPSLPRLRYFMLALPFFQFSVMLVPISTALAVLRFRLWDIDLLINRSLVYGALTGILGSLYLGSVVFLQRILPAESEIAVVTSTLAILALFSPLRSRIQGAIDRRFYRQKYDADRALADFANSVRDQVELGTLIEELNTVVEATVQPKFLSLWIASEPTAEAAPELQDAAG